MSSGNFWGGLNSLRRHVVSPGEDERDRKTYQQKHDDKTQRPVRQFPCRNNRRTNLNDESRSDDISGRNAINFPPLQLLEETAHKQSGLIIPIVRHGVSKKRYAQARSKKAGVLVFVSCHSKKYLASGVTCFYKLRRPATHVIWQRRNRSRKLAAHPQCDRENQNERNRRSRN